MLPAGTTLGPYRIVAPLGIGGMGEVYRAHDARLGRDVAVKVILAELARDPERIRRFEQEARSAGALNHPNVCTILDLGAHEGSPFVVMELLEGESLRERLNAGPIPAPKAADYAAQAARGLAAAHEKGIVHRDLKPENLFLTRDGRVKVLDFGLAKLTRAELPAPMEGQPGTAAGTEAGIILGTVGYMAPEQVLGKTVDARSDLFALGTILFELLTGKRAFQGASHVETMHAILNDEPQPLAASGREFPPALEPIVRHCLEKNPEERFQSARDLAFHLEAAGGATIPARSATGAAKVAPGGWRARVGALVFSALLLVVAVAAAFLWWRGGDSGPASKLRSERVAVAVFENQTGDESLDPLGRMTSDWITQGLSRVEGLEVAPSTLVLYAQPPGSRAQVGGDPIGALAKETGAGTVVSGVYYLQGDTLRFQAKVTDAVHRKLLRALDPVSGPRGAPLEAIEGLRQRVMGAVAASLDFTSDLALQQPPLYAAYREFIAGFEVFVDEPDEALRHFEQAVRLDSTFLQPLFYEAYLRDQAGDHARVEAILRMLAARRERLLPFGRRWLDTIVAYSAHRYPEALQHLRVAEKAAPRDPLTVLWIGFMAKLSNRPQDAVDAYDRFGAPPYSGHPLGRVWLHQLCDALHMLGRHERELKEVHRGKARDPIPLELGAWEVAALAALGRVDPLNRLIDQRLAATPGETTAGDVMLIAAAELRAHGHRQASLDIGARAVTWYRDRLGAEPGKQEWRAGLVAALRGAERWEEAYDSCRTLSAQTPQDADCRGQLGCLAARLGKRDEAVRISTELQALNGPYLFGAHTYRRACIAALLGEKQKAIELLREAFAEGVAYGTRHHREIDLEPLWGYPPFKELLKPRG